jgi:hypothetical protein
MSTNWGPRVNSAKGSKQNTGETQKCFQVGLPQSPIYRAVGDLEKMERIVVMLFYYKEFSLTEIGNLLGLTQGQVFKLRTSALKNLGQAIRCFGSLSEASGVIVDLNGVGQTKTRRASIGSGTPLH